MTDELKEPEKVSAWTDADREVPVVTPGTVLEVKGECYHPEHYPDFVNTRYDGEKQTGPCVGHTPCSQKVDFPGWINTFFPGAVFQINGWDAIVRHVGCEGGRWLVLIEPTVQVALKRAGATRAEFRRLKNKVGKKEALRLVHDRK